MPGCSPPGRSIRSAIPGFYAVCSWDAVNEVIARPEDFSSNLTATMTYQDGKVGAFPMGELGGDTQALATADDPAHAAHRKLLVPQLAGKRIRALESLVAETEDRLWNEGVQSGSIEWMSAMANRLPMIIVTRLIGVPDLDADQLMRLGYASTKVVEGLVDQDELAAAGVALMELAGYINEHFQRAAADPQDNLLGDLATARAAGELTDLTALNIMATLFSAGGESTASLIGSAAHVLANRPDIQQQVRENPDLLGAFLEEVLRYEPPFRGHYRHVVRDTTLRGVDLVAGSRLVLLWGAANRDPSHFDRSQRIPAGPRRRQGPYRFRQGRTLLRRRRTRPPGGQDRDRPTARSHDVDRGGRHRPVAAQPSGASTGTTNSA